MLKTACNLPYVPGRGGAKKKPDGPTVTGRMCAGCGGARAIRKNRTFRPHRRRQAKIGSAIIIITTTILYTRRLLCTTPSYRSHTRLSSCSDGRRRRRRLRNECVAAASVRSHAHAHWFSCNFRKITKKIAVGRGLRFFFFLYRDGNLTHALTTVCHEYESKIFIKQFRRSFFKTAR